MDKLSYVSKNILHFYFIKMADHQISYSYYSNKYSQAKKLNDSLVFYTFQIILFIYW